ncbi:MAG: hypothetical protein WAT09_17135 [Paracoccaceae bacterium]
MTTDFICPCVGPLKPLRWLQVGRNRLHRDRDPLRPGDNAAQFARGKIVQQQRRVSFSTLASGVQSLPDEVPNGSVALTWV